MPNSFAFVLPFPMLLHPMLQFVMLHGTFLLYKNMQLISLCLASMWSVHVLVTPLQCCQTE